MTQAVAFRHVASGPGEVRAVTAQQRNDASAVQPGGWRMDQTGIGLWFGREYNFRPKNENCGRVRRLERIDQSLDVRRARQRDQQRFAIETQAGVGPQHLGNGVRVISDDRDTCDRSNAFYEPVAGAMFRGEEGKDDSRSFGR